MKQHILLLLLVIFHSLQQVFASVEVRSTHMTTSNGIANNSIRCIYQDSKGFIWLGTLNGLSRYDGSSFVNFRPEAGNRLSLLDHRVSALEEDEHGFLWIRSSDEVFSCYDLKRDCFVDFTGCGEYRQSYTDRLTDREGNIWLWHEKNGCRKVTYADGRFSSVAFSQELGNLPCNQVYYIDQDTQGTIWIGTNKGVAQVTGNQAVLQKTIPHTAFCMKSKGKDVFFLSSDGILYLKEGEAQARQLLRISPKEPLRVYSTFQLQDDWVICTQNGTYFFDMNTRQLRQEASLNVPNAQVQQDNHGNFWMYNHSGTIWYIHADSRNVKSFRLIPADKMNYIDEERYHIVHDSRDIVWISTYGNGLFAYDLHKNELQHFESTIGGDNHISSNFLLYLMEDRAGGIWVSSEYSGISRLTVLNEGADRLFADDETLSDRSNTVRMIHRMSNGDIWIGTRRGGLHIYDAELQKKKQSQCFESNIYAVAEAADGKLWIGSRGNGLRIGDRWYRYDAGDSTSIANNNIFTICKDSKQRMWIGTFGGGLNLAEQQGTDYTFRRFFDTSYSQRQVRNLMEDRNGWMWAGTSAGVYLFHPDSLMANPQQYLAYNFGNGKLRSNEIKCIYQDSKDRIWIGTSGKGFSMCRLDTDYRHLTFQHYDESKGLVSNMVQSIIEDTEGKLWIATEYGISRFDPDIESFENFFFSSHILSNVYGENSACLGSNGRLLFGSNHGLVVITPEKIVNYSAITPVVAFTNLLVNGSSMRPGDPDSPLRSAMVYTDEIELKYYQNSFTIDFSTFDYSSANATKYTYRLDNYDKTWSPPSSLNFAAYKNLSPGTYVLRAKACNSTGVWADKETVLKIVVSPPFWQTSWAFFIYALLISIALYITFKLMHNFNTLRNRIQVEKQLTEYKLVFFTNISHEFRTPLTLIQGALEKMKRAGKLSPEMAYSLQIMDKSTQRMLRLINQLLEFRKMQNNKLALSLEETDVMAFLHEIFLSFNDAAESKNMDFQFVPSVASYLMYIDKGNLDKVTYNLLSNAFKYTPSGGKVIFAVTVDEVQHRLVISVADTGVGIPKEKRDELFKRFMQSSFSGSSVGVGLHLTHELVQVHQGSIVYNENPGGGSVFTVTLPTDPSVYQPQDFLIPHNVLLEEENRQHAAWLEEEQRPSADRVAGEQASGEQVSGEQEPSAAQEASEQVPSGEEHKTEVEKTADPKANTHISNRKILIIEDDNDVRDFLKEEIGQYFEVATESDGTAGLERARHYDADLIICDVLMPGLTGFEVTRRLKKDFSTSHIPIILLTAMSSAESHLEGVESGADAYITKPFSPKLLLARVFKLIEQREKLRLRFSNDPTMAPTAICGTEKDQEFADKLKNIVLSQLENPQFSIDEFASLMGLGRTVFYRKVRGITGYTPNEYIRIIRMKRGAELLLEGKYTVAEVSYQIGINDPFYFSKCFKQQFGMSPTAYCKAADGTEEEKETPKKQKKKKDA